MAVIAPQGVGFVDKHDLNHKVVTPEDTEVIAGTIVARLRERSTEVGELRGLVDALLAASGLTVQSPVDGQTAALVQQQGSLTAVAIRALMGEHLVGVRADAYGVVGDGVTDDTDALHAAASAAASAGLPLVIPGGYIIGISSYTRFPAGLTLMTNGVKFTQLVPMGRAPVVGLGPRSTVVGGLLVDTLGGDACQGVHIADAPDVTIDHVEVTSAVPGAGRANVRDNGLRVINSPGLRIGRARASGYDWAVWSEQADGLTLGHLEVEDYSLALRVKDCARVRIHSGHMHGAGPNTGYLPGYNGVLIESDIPGRADDILFHAVTVEDAGEHGFRVGGQNSVRNVTFSRCLAKNVGGSGFKTLPGPAGDAGDGVRVTGVVLDHCTVEDAGEINQNCSGFLIQRADDVRITAPSIRKKDKTYSAVEGIRMSGVTDVTVTDAKIKDTKNYAVRLDEAYGNVSDIRISGRVQTTTGQGVYLQNPGVQFRDIHVDMYVENATVGGSAFYAGRATAAEDSGTWAGVNTLRLTISESTPSETSINPNSSVVGLEAFFADVIGRRAWIVPFRAGSTWTDTLTNTRQVKRADDWSVI